MHEIVDREVAVSTDMHAKRRNIEGAINFGAGNNILADFGHITLVPVKGYGLVFLDQVSVFVRRRAQLFNEINRAGVVIPPFLMGVSRRIHAAVFSFIAGVMPPMAMLGRSLL